MNGKLQIRRQCPNCGRLIRGPAYYRHAARCNQIDIAAPHIDADRYVLIDGRFAPVYDSAAWTGLNGRNAGSVLDFVVRARFRVTLSLFACVYLWREISIMRRKLAPPTP